MSPWSLFSKKKSNSNVVHWAYDDRRYPWLTAFSLLYYPPEPVLQHYYGQDGASHFMKCPSWRESLQNTYAIRCPIDVEITYDRSTPKHKTMNVVKPEKAHKELRQSMLHPRFNESTGNAPEVFSLLITPYLFYSDASITMELLPPFLEWENPNQVRLIPGSFNIGKWRRHIEYAAELRHPVGTFKLKRGDVMNYVRFTSEHDPQQRLRLVESNVSEQLRREIQENTQMKFAYAKCPLRTLYTLREQLNIRKKTCPQSTGNESPSPNQTDTIHE